MPVYGRSTDTHAETPVLSRRNNDTSVSAVSVPDPQSLTITVFPLILHLEYRRPEATQALIFLKCSNAVVVSHDQAAVLFAHRSSILSPIKHR